MKYMDQEREQCVRLDPEPRDSSCSIRRNSAMGYVNSLGMQCDGAKSVERVQPDHFRRE